ncbi:MAG: MFS transporter [Beijerinckiaceae bacterium]
MTAVTAPAHGTPSTQIDDATARANILRLSAAQALAGANATVIMTTGAVVGSILAPSLAWATVPVSTMVVGTAIGTLPAGYIARKHGRKTVFMLGTGIGFFTGMLAAFAIVIGSFFLFCTATLIAGFYQSVAHSFRFAATDGASPALRPKAISWVMAGGIFSGVLGPQLVTITMNWWAPYIYAASFVAQGCVALVCMWVLSGTNLPPPEEENLSAGRPLMEIARQKSFIVAALCGMISYSLMNLVMTSAPLAMKMCGLPQSAANNGITWHVIAMFAPSFFTGHLIAKFGAGRVVALGLGILCLAAVAGLMGITVWHFWIGLILLGIGWNFGFVGASAMVVDTHRPEERNKVQAFNDFLVFGMMAITSFSSGQILAFSGWDMVNWVAFPMIGAALLALVAGGQLVRRREVV